VILHNGKFEATQGYCTDVFFRQATEWIDSVRGKRPFFAYVTPNAAHAPLDVPPRYADRYRGKVPDKVAKFYGMIENIDENFGQLLGQLKMWGIENDTLVIFLTDNGSASGTSVFNAGMRGAKNTPYQGGHRVPSFWRWPAGFAGGKDCSALTAHIDVVPTIVEIAGIKLKDESKQQIEGRSLLPILNNARAEWADRTLITHLGRWPRGKAAESQFAGCSIRNERFALVNNRELYDLREDPGETTNVFADHPQVVERLRGAYDEWWHSVLPCLENEQAIGPATNPFHDLYYQQFGPAKKAATP
jgi:arylsulfatase